MDIPRITSPPSIRVHDINASRHAHRSAHRSPSHASNDFSKYSGPMSIPNLREAPPPPPLPPPRFIEDIAVGRDPGWKWANARSAGEYGDTGSSSVSPNSSLRGSWDIRMDDGETPDQSDYMRRRSSGSTVKSPRDLEMGYDFSGHKDEGYHSLSGSSLAHQLQGARNLEKRNLENSSQAYDQQLLSKIGKPKTPPRSSTLGSIDASPTSRSSRYQDKHRQHTQSRAASGRSQSISSDIAIKPEPSFNDRWMNSPQSAVVSPGLVSYAASAKSYMEYRNPSLDSSAPSSAFDSDQFAHVRQSSGRSGSDGSVRMSMSFDDAASPPKRESYDQSVFADPDSDFPMEETGGMRQLHLDDRTPPSMDVHSPSSRSGTKRKALSPPPREAQHDDKATVGGSSELNPRRTSGHLSANRLQPEHASFSSTSSSGLRNGSFASSAGFSAPGSSYTSFSSHERLSPAGISPSADLHDTLTLDPSLQASSPQSHQLTAPENKSAAAIARKMPSDTAGRGKQYNMPKMQANYHMCECCPKKPKKFDTLEELHNHRLEKQYVCPICHNRFKNKNEMERHQNSLHLRRHSWSCAALESRVENAFHPTTSIPSANNSNPPPPSAGIMSPTDTCGYCGQEFSNHPEPDWGSRFGHLQTVHKFGECNQSKKFFRADHFRQHLKHSHAGTSGKWTNMLENACMKTEQPPLTGSPMDMQAQQQHAAPIANMMVPGPPMGSPRSGGFGPGPGPAMGMGMGMPGSSGLKNESIPEMHNEM